LIPSTDLLDFEFLDVVCGLVTLIAGSSAELARMVATERARGIEHSIPTFLCLILVQHAHELQEGHECPGHPLGAHQHAHPVNLALESLYTLSLHYDLRAVRIGTRSDYSISLDQAIAEYGDFLHGFVHHQVCSKYAQAYLARLLALSPSGAPPLDPPIETEAAQQRRLVQYADSMQRARRRALEQRRRDVSSALRLADAASARGDDAIRASSLREAVEAYGEAVGELSGLESDAGAAWPLVLALSGRSEALLQLGRAEEALEDVIGAYELLHRHAAAFDPGDSRRIKEELRRREAMVERALAAVLHASEPERVDAELRAQARADRRPRVRVLEEEATAVVEARALQAVTASMAALSWDADGVECSICQEGSSVGPLEDFCGHNHPLHPGCASLWRSECLRLRARQPTTHSGPHCPTCRRAI